MRNFFAIFLLLALLSGCAASKAQSKSRVPVAQGIEGFVQELRGNQMPSPDREPAPPTGVRTMVFVYEQTNVSQTQRTGTSPFYQAVCSRLVQAVESDSTGYFAVALPPGHYSLFVLVNGQFYASRFDTQNNIFPVTVEANKAAKVNIVIRAGAHF